MHLTYALWLIQGPVVASIAVSLLHRNFSDKLLSISPLPSYSDVCCGAEIINVTRIKLVHSTMAG